ncbi:hypothetical protein [Glaciecola sp. KUL10]|uniref:hypothetical protein n=1 Tax=Glaciecola sp. (strain KUL10) TaxID=2161813 RepID=UPI000D7839B2|nr:hypothetical protein [Glaciecola sp. KUL10]GBL04178.1 hypothetical protein KUL10_14840 [Glaciecola sp. KUL10]
MNQLVNSFKNSDLYLQVKNQTRLQWLLLVVMLILAISLCERLIVAVNSQSNELSRSYELMEKLENVKAHPLSEKTISEIDTAFDSILKQMQTVNSVSVAEADALKQMESLVADVFKSLRMNLIGNDSLTLASYEVITIRVQASGQLEAANLVTLLEKIENSANQRLYTFQYSPRTSDRVEIVIDFQFLESNND